MNTSVRRAIPTKECEKNKEQCKINKRNFVNVKNVKMNVISVTFKMVKKVIMNLDLSKASGPDCISVVVLKNCEPKLFLHVS